MQSADVRGDGDALRITRRLGSTPQERGSTQGVSCPDLFELASGDFAVIGTDQTSELDSQLPILNASRAPHERAVVIPRRVLLDAIDDLNREL